jgi:hypothetical protein
MHTLSELEELLSATTAAKREKLAVVISCKATDASPAQLCEQFRALRSRLGGTDNATKSYKQIVTDAADAIHLDWTVIEGHQDWEALKSEVIEEHIARRLYGGAKQLPEAGSVPLRPVRVLIRWSLADLLAKVTPATSWAADRYAEKLAGAAFTLSPEWNALLAGIMFVHTEVR